MTLRWIEPITAGLLAAGTLGCTDSPPPPAKGASNFALTSGGCNFTGGFTIPEVGVPTTRTTLGQRVEDGKSGAKVRCTVSRQGNAFNIAGSVLQGNRSLSVVNGQVGLDPTIKGHSGPATIIHTDGMSTGTLESLPGGCTINIYPNQDLAEGRVWGTFLCSTGDAQDGVRSSNNPSASCNAEGSFVFENCNK